MSRIQNLLFAAILISLPGCGDTEQAVIPANDDPAVIPTDSSAVDPIPEKDAPAESSSSDAASTEPEPTTDTTADTPTTDAALENGTASAGSELQLKSLDELQALIAEHKGKVVVVDYWSTWCAPCVREFPHLVELKEKFGDDVVAISACCNYEGLPDSPPESYREEVGQFLDEQNADKLVNVVLTTESEVVFDEHLKGAIPIVDVYGRDGELAKRVDNSDTEKLKATGEFTYEKDIVPLVEVLVAKDASAEEQTSE